VARACARDLTACTSQASAAELAEQWANLNAGPDGVSGISEACGSANLAECAPLRDHQWECRSPDPYPNFARVHAVTQQNDGTSILPPIFSRAFGGEGASLWACAQATWGAARQAEVTFPIALSACDYVSEADAVIQIFEPSTFVPGQGPTCTLRDADGNEQVLRDMVNGFFYVQLDSTRRECTEPVLVSVGDVLDRSENIVQLCGNRYETALQSLIGQQSALPIFDQIPGGGGLGTAQMRVASFVAFTLRGYRLGGGRESGAPPGGWPRECRANNRCIYGTFGVQLTGGSGVDPGAPNLGLQAVQLIP
jgi:hypothetical protein